jgi:hypothetical protein
MVISSIMRWRGGLMRVPAMGPPVSRCGWTPKSSDGSGRRSWDEIRVAENRLFRSLALQGSQQHPASVLDGDDLVPSWREDDLEDGTSGFVCGRPQPSAVRLDNRAADR